ncbi:sulfoxide reductase heme-binding subunit YedZ [Methylomagnum ishizawai]|uniref:Protein-methionine-sulfoxide reductase heme-binding subunit MsrQ n=1 Tax=Methylomagnum ishizawai TaxID=1760988 RepID=A0A1Y6DBK1_9GAMM|nr:protein-methionine-sulfoxide reductase heme-binding subunit MsrQ [Methylomagnum ishizawai]SMF97632.1 sulfoxide reductase heme-binding subunit YedZ [Methylomagnum ishizawai]
MKPRHTPGPVWLRGLKSLVFLSGLLPLAGLLWEGWTDSLGANPIERITRATGWWTLAFLMIGLAVTPLRKALGRPWLGQFRRMLGLFAFFYASLHLAIYVGLDQYFAWGDILADIAKRPYITVGCAAFMLMLPLAATSTDGMVRRLGGQRWKRLHRWVYPIALAGVAHFWWLVKQDISEPLVFAAILALLLAARLPPRWGKDVPWPRKAVAPQPDPP